MMNTTFLDGQEFRQAFAVVDLQTGANTGDWVKANMHDKLYAGVASSIGTAGDDLVITINEASDNVGTGSAAFAQITDIYHLTGATPLSGVAQWTRVTQTAASTYDTATIDGAENEQIVMVEISPQRMASGNSFIQMTVADVGGNAQLGWGFYLFHNARYAGFAHESLL